MGQQDNRDEIEDIFRHRLTIAQNAGVLQKYASAKGKNSSIGQMSLFAEVEEYSKPELSKYIDHVSKFQMSIEESERIGVTLTYNIMDEYIIYDKVFTTHSIRDISNMDDNCKSMLTIGMVTDVAYRVSTAGNKYIMLSISNRESSIKLFVTGKSYSEYSAFFRSNTVYLFQLSKTGDSGFINLIKAIEPKESNPNNKIKRINISIDDVSNIIKIRKHIYDNMIGDKAELFFKVGDDLIKAPYKVKISNDDMIELSKLSCSVELIK